MTFRSHYFIEAIYFFDAVYPLQTHIKIHLIRDLSERLSHISYVWKNGMVLTQQFNCCTLAKEQKCVQQKKEIFYFSPLFATNKTFLWDSHGFRCFSIRLIESARVSWRMCVVYALKTMYQAAWNKRHRIDVSTFPLVKCLQP